MDYNIEVSNFKEKQINITTCSNKHPGGKGINVSQVLKNFGIDSIAMGFLGGFTGAFIKNELIKKNIKCDFIEIEEDTRINIKMKNCNKESEINGNSPKIRSQNKNQLIQKIMNLQKNDILVLSGSVPDSLNKNIYEEIMGSLPLGVKVILDTKTDAMTNGILKKPFLIKPNIHELEDIFKIKISNRDQIIEYAKRLQIMGAQNVMVSMAADGAIFVNSHKTYVISAPKGEVKNSVGAGDSLVAGFIIGLVEGLSIEDTIKIAIASGSASAFSNTLCTKEEMKKLINNINIKII